MLSPQHHEQSLSSNTDARRSSRIPLSLRIGVSGVHPQSGVRFEATGLTLGVNKHGALIRTIPGLPAGMILRITVTGTSRSANARIIWDVPQSEGRYGIQLETPENLWGVFFPPADWATAQ